VEEEEVVEAMAEEEVEERESRGARGGEEGKGEKRAAVTKMLIIASGRPRPKISIDRTALLCARRESSAPGASR
jgi:hypothetical protein